MLVNILRESSKPGGVDDSDWLQRRILWLLRKFAHRKYRHRFENALEELRAFGRSDPRRFSQLIRGLEEVEELARARFEG